MCLRRWLHRFYVKVREVLNWPRYSNGRYDGLIAVGYFPDGGTYTWRGRPWGLAWEDFKEVLEEGADYVTMNMQGSYWRFGP